MKALAVVQHVKHIFDRNGLVWRRGLHRPLVGSAKTKFLFAAVLLSVPASLAFATTQSGNAGQSMNLHHDDTTQPQTEPESTVAPPATSSSSSTVTLHATSGSSGTGGPSSGGQDNNSASGQSSNVHLEVNGKQIHVPSSGSVHRTFTSNGGQSTIDISVDNQQSSTTSSSNQMTFTIDQQSDSTVTEEP